MSIVDQMNADSASEPAPAPVSIADQMAQDSKGADAITMLTPKPKDAPGAWMSALAGAGHSTGEEAMAVQQWVGKGLQQFDATKDVGDWLYKDAISGVAKLNDEFAPYRAANPKSAIAGEIGGAVANPANYVIPGGSAGGALGLVQSAAQGAALSTAMTPVSNPDASFIEEKAKQGAAGAVGGVAGRAVANLLGGVANKFIDWGRSFLGATGDATKAADAVLKRAMDEQRIDPTKMPGDVYEGLRQQVAAAVKTGNPLDPSAIDRVARAKSLPVPVTLTQGMASRNQFDYALEQNLSKIENVGEPISASIRQVNSDLVANVDAMGARGAPNVVDAGVNVKKSLQATDNLLQGAVSDAYGAFKASTGKDLDVPLQGLAQDYARIKDQYADAIPAAVRNKFESLGLMNGTQTRTISVDDAEGLIKNYINANYDASNPVQSRALDALRKSVQNSIGTGTSADLAGSEAAQLAKNARQMASARFDLQDTIPMLRSAVTDEQPDKIVSKYILGGNQDQIAKTMGFLDKTDPAAAQQLRGSVMSWIRSQATNKAAEGNGNEIFSEAKMRGIVNDPNMAARLRAALGDQQFGNLQNLQKVAEDAFTVPKQSGVNFSNTAAAAANMVQGAGKGSFTKGLDLLAGSGIPLVSPTAASASNQARSQAQAKLAQEAANPSLTRNQDLSKFLGNLGIDARRAAVVGGSTNMPEILRLRNLQPKQE